MPTGFTGCNTTQMQTIANDLDRARRFSTTSIICSAGSFVPSTREKVKNIFKIDVESADNPIGAAFEAVNLFILKKNYMILRASLDRSFPKTCETKDGLLAFVSTSDFWTKPCISLRKCFPINSRRAARPITIIHERAHTVLRLPGTPELAIRR